MNWNLWLLAIYLTPLLDTVVRCRSGLLDFRSAMTSCVVTSPFFVTEKRNCSAAWPSSASAGAQDSSSAC